MSPCVIGVKPHDHALASLGEHKPNRVSYRSDRCFLGAKKTAAERVVRCSRKGGLANATGRTLKARSSAAERESDQLILLIEAERRIPVCGYSCVRAG